MTSTALNHQNTHVFFVNSQAHSNGTPTTQLEAITQRNYSRHRSQLVDRWLVYADAEGFTAAKGVQS